MRVTTFSELHHYMATFAEQEHITLLIVQSRGGLGKTFQIRRAFDGEKYNLFMGHATPLSIYKNLYFNRNDPTIFDDVDALLDNKTTVALLKQICDTNREKKVAYATTAHQAADVPQEYTTKTRVVIITNDLKKVGKNLGALHTRGVFIDFDPSNGEVFKTLSSFAQDKEILSFIGGVYEDLEGFNFRVYEKAVQLKKSGLDWKDYLEREYDTTNYRLIVEEMLTLKPSERLDYWKSKTGMSRRSMFRYQKKYKGGE